MRRPACVFVWLLAAMVLPHQAAAQTGRARTEWVALAKSGFTVPDGAKAIDLLVEMNALLASPDPVLRDDVAFSAAERWIVRDGRVAPDEMRRLLQLWTANLQDGLDAPGDDRIFKRSFSALSLSLIAARDLTAPFLEAGEVATLLRSHARLLQSRARSARVRPGARLDAQSSAHLRPLKFLARNPKLPAGSDARLLEAVQRKIEAADTVFTWGENDRMALALQSMVRRADAVPATLDAWMGALARGIQGPLGQRSAG